MKNNHESLKLLEAEIGGRKAVLYASPHGDKELYADGIHGVSISPQTVKFNLHTVNPWHSTEQEEYREVVARIVMPLPTFVSVAQFMIKCVNEMGQKSLIQIDGGQQGPENAPKTAPAIGNSPNSLTISGERIGDH